MRRKQLIVLDRDIALQGFVVYVRGIGGYARDVAYADLAEAEARAREWAGKGDTARIYQTTEALLTTFYPPGANDN